MKELNHLLLLFGLLIVMHACESTGKPTPLAETPRENSGKVFELLSTEESGIDFNNLLVEDEKLNFYAYQYLYNGGGVAIGDINNDGLADVYFTGTVADDKLFLNKGNMRFEDISESAGIQKNNGIKTGVTMVDVNADGFLDIYVNRSGWYKTPSKRANLLYLNKGDNTFEESAQLFGLAETGHSVQAGFFDYDKDGDLDCYITNHPLFETPEELLRQATELPPDKFRDKLYRNNGDNTFTEVSKEARIYNFGHGLGLAISDFNHDGWPDVYVANDFQVNDFYYINNGDGTFTDQSKLLTGHVSYFAMGNDAADINNDGLMDLFVVEMLAEDNKRQKTNMAPMNPNLFWGIVESGHHYQFMRNTLQVNNGKGDFSEIAYLSGLANTDWSWAPLFADFDHDGFKDLAITNGYLRDTQDKDLWKRIDDAELSFKTMSLHLKSTRIKNYVFKNEGAYQFSDKSAEWGFDFSGYSNGMAYGDLDNDGDLDLIVNNFNDPASVYKNTTADRELGHFLSIKLNGPPQNRNGLGTKLTLTTKKGEQFQEFWVTRGFESSCDQKVHFGIVEGDQIQELLVEWPDGKIQSFAALEFDQFIEINYQDARTNGEVEAVVTKTIFKSIGSKPIFVHQENDYDDYEKETLLPHKQSENGPKITVGDVNGDGFDDFYIGGASGQAGRLILQLGQNRFAISSANVFQADSLFEDVGATFFDADSDGDLDLYVVSGGNEFEAESNNLQDRIYLNDGKGLFQPDRQMLPQMHASGGTVTAADFDGDGDQDLFVGGRITPGKYPFAPRSYLLRNDGNQFVDVTELVAPDLMNPGLVTSAVWTDFNRDNQQDLIVVGEWTGILMFENESGKLKKVSAENEMEEQTGWWNKIVAIDLDQDGDEDYVLGNLGLNYKYHASKEEPFHIYAHDFDESGSIDIVLGYYNQGTCYPVRGRQCSAEQMPMIAEKFETYEEFGTADIKTVYGEKLEEALHLEAYNFASSILWNEGEGNFNLKPLPIEAQFAPINGIVAEDFDKNGTIDLLLAGNLFQSEVETGRADAGRGLLLFGDGKGGYEVITKSKSGFYAPMDVKDLAIISAGPNSKRTILVANNNLRMQLFTEN